MGQTKPYIKAHQRVLPDGEELGQDGGGGALDWSQVFRVTEWALPGSLWVATLSQPGCALSPLQKVVLPAPLIQTALQLPPPHLSIHPPAAKVV